MRAVRSRWLFGFILVIACGPPRDNLPDLSPLDLSSSLPAVDMIRTVGNGMDLGSPDLACVPETDSAFCQRLGKSCEPVSAPDNCGLPRTANCGSCGGVTPACVANVCRAPVCGTSFMPNGSDVVSANISGRQDALLGVSANGGSVLYLQATSNCVGNGARLFIGDDASGALNFVSQDLSAVPALASFVKAEETMTLTGDGLTIIGVTTTQQFASTTRSAAGKTDFPAPAHAMFDTLNGTLPAGGTLSWPLVSADLLAFYFRVDNASNANANGVYETVRSATSVPFPAATRMPPVVQGFQAISGMSSDRMTAFMATFTYGNGVLVRNSVLSPFAAPSGAVSLPATAWRIMPFAGCARLLGTYEPGGCPNETMRVWSR